MIIMKAKTLILLALVAILLSSCSLFAFWGEVMRCDFTEAEQIIPYRNGQVYSFIVSTGEVINVTAQRETIWLRHRLKVDNDTDYISYRRDIVSLNSESGNLRINFTFTASRCLPSEIPRPGGRYNTAMFSISHYDVGVGFSLRTNAEGILTDASDTFFHESIEINSRVYCNVIERSFLTNAGSERQLFYNTTYGILQVNKDGENFLTINH